MTAIMLQPGEPLDRRSRSRRCRYPLPRPALDESKPAKKKGRRVPQMLLAHATAIPKLAGLAEPKLDGFRAVVTVENRRARVP